MTTNKNRITAFALAVIMLCFCFSPLTVEVNAADKVLTLRQAKALAVANSTACEKVENKILTKEASYKQAVKAIALKKKRLSTFSWSPLLSFKFPQSPNMSQAFEFTYKPLKIQSEIDTYKHKYNDTKLSEYEKVQQLFVTIVACQDKLDYNNMRLTEMEETLKKNKARVLTGEANPKDVEAMENAVTAIKSKIVSDTRDLDSSKKKLSKALGMDVTTGYTFENPFVDSEIPRDVLPKLKQSTFDNDQSYYEACATANTAYTALKLDFDLIKGHYKGGDVNIIASYVNQALNGQDVNSKAFKGAYDAFLRQIDHYWEGYKWIIFFKFPRVWFKGELDGVNFIEDEPYAMYEAALEYQDARLERDSLKEELDQQVEDAYNNYVAMRKAYTTNVTLCENTKAEMEKNTILNRIGEMTYEEYKSAQDSADEIEQAMLSSLADYSNSLYNLDRLTCGAVSQYLSGVSPDMFSVGEGVSFINDDTANGAIYNIQSIIQNEEFIFGINIPEDFDTDITDYELIVDGTVIGTKTKADKTLRHLTLVKNDTQEVKVRLYDGEKVVCDCVIDPEIYSGPLDIVTGYQVTDADDTELGTYVVKDTSYGTEKLTIKPVEGSEIKSFRLKTEDGKYIGGTTLNKIDSSFNYIPVVGNSLADVKIECFDENSEFLYEGYFDTQNLKVKKSNLE